MTWVEDLLRIGIEGDDDACSLQSLGQSHRGLDQPLVGNMDPVEHPDSDNRPWRDACECVKPFYHSHGCVVD